MLKISKIITPEKLKKVYQDAKENKDLSKPIKEMVLQEIINIAMEDKRIDKMYKEANTTEPKEDWIKEFLEGE